MAFKITRLKQNIFLGDGMLNLFLFKVCNTRNAISQDKSFVLVNQYVCSADYGSFFLNISLMYFLPV
jgi:hypothetical protein